MAHMFTALDEVRWGILGCGDVTEVKSGPGLRQVAGSSVVAVMRRDGAKAADYARRHGVGKWYDDARKLVEDPQVNAVYVATPPGHHLEGALLAAAAGKPCYVEKPMARNFGECAEMIAAFERAADGRGVPLFVAYYRRALPKFLKVKELLDGGAIGQLTGFAVRYARPGHRQSHGWRTDPAIAGGGLFLDLGSHALDLLDYWLGPLQNVGGQAWAVVSGGVEDVVVLSCTTVGGVVGCGSWNFASDAEEDVLELSGTDGRIRVPCFGPGGVELLAAGKVQTWDLPSPREVQTPMIGEIVKALRGQGAMAGLPTGEAAARTSAVMDGALAGFRVNAKCKPSEIRSYSVKT